MRCRGTKCAPHYVLEVPAGEKAVVRSRFFAESEDPGTYFGEEAFDAVFEARIKETDQFYNQVGNDFFILDFSLSGIVYSLSVSQCFFMSFNTPFFLEN